LPRSRIGQIVAAGALALIAGAPVAACGARPVSPIPAQAAEPAATASPAPSASAPTGPPSRATEPPIAVRPAKTRTVKPTSTKPTSTCFGAVRYDLDLHNTVLDLIPTMCFRTGGVLRLQGIGPGLVTATPRSVVSSTYEAGVVDLRFIRPGTATVTIPQDDMTYTITVVVIR
jgi:hypothetical protein